MKLKHSKNLTYDEQYVRCLEFIRMFEDYNMKNFDPEYGKRKYGIQLVDIFINQAINREWRKKDIGNLNR